MIDASEVKIYLFLVVLAALFFRSVEAQAAEEPVVWSGHLRGAGSIDYFSTDHLLSTSAGQSNFINGSLDGRLNMISYPADRLRFELAYEVVLTSGQTREALYDYTEKNADTSETALFEPLKPSDDDKFFSLTKIIADETSYLFYQRLDRLFLSWNTDYGTLSVGRQPLTWGNGMLFNPADLINPFAPSNIIRDYKIGSDMILFQTAGELITDFQLVGVARKDQDTGEFASAESTAGMKVRFSFSQRDLDLYLLKNYQDPVAGAGFTTYLGGGVFRSDLTWTYLEDDPDMDSFFSGVMNFDYSWIWLGKNWYGFIEYYYNGLGSSPVAEALTNEALVERLARGEIFVTGRNYLDGLLQCELHPLVNIYTTLIYNFDDHSILLQPRLSWDYSESVQLLAGFNITLGSSGSEFGDQPDQQTGSDTSNADQAYLLVTWYF
jgi:hypothetical protein